MQTDVEANTRETTPADLRGILKYVPEWRNHTFVIALDGSVLEEENFGNILIELAVLRNLGIRIVLVYGIGAQLEKTAAERSLPITDSRGHGPTDNATLDLAIEVSGKVGHLITQGLTQLGLRVATPNAVRATEKGIIKGVDQLCAGKVDRIDESFLNHLIDKEIVPIVAPIAFTREGAPLRLNSDLLASRTAIELRASKLIFLLPYPGLTYQGSFRLNAPVNEVRQVLDRKPEDIDEEIRSKALHAVQTIEAGVPRAHLIDCRIPDGLLTEIFSKVGIGSMIHSNPYTQIRRARKKDVSPIFNITKNGVRDEMLRSRSRESIEQTIDHYFVYEVDESVIACFRLTPVEGSSTMELGSVYVQAAYQGRNIGQALVEFALEEARKSGAERVFALTTQAIQFFKDTCDFSEGSADDLPRTLRDAIQKTGRNSRVFYKDV